MPSDEDVIAALLRELAGYEAMGDEINADGVRAELKRIGYKAAAPAERAEKTTPAREKR